jgi:hypothetical protein
LEGDNFKMADELVEKTAATSQNANKLHGTNGLFGVSGLERDIITAHVRPFGIGNELPMLSSNSEDPRFGSITGFTAAIGNQPTAVCADAPYAFMKGCNLTSRFGVLRFDTNTIDIGKTFLKINRGEMTDLTLRGRVLGLTGLEPSGLNETGIVELLTMSEMVTAGVLAERALNQQLWRGVTTIANQFPGLDAQIATGQIDADSHVACPALDSDVKDFGYDAVGGSGRDIVEYLSMLCYFLQHNAYTMGLDPASWRIVMRPELWFELTAVWPIQYNTQKANAITSGAVVMIDGRENVVQRDAMRNGMYIDINGLRYPVTVDTGIFEHDSTNNANLRPGEYASSIYVVPMTITGGFPVTYREYLDFRMGASNEALLNGMNTFWTDNGIYTWAIENVKWCYKLSIRTEQRVILRTPQLAGKLQRVKYSPLQHLRSDDPASSYFQDGGVSIRNYTPGQAVWEHTR